MTSSSPFFTFPETINESHNGRKARSSGSKKCSFQSFLCSTTWDSKDSETHSSYGDSCFSFWVDVAKGSDGTYPASIILSHMAVFLKLWHVHGQNHIAEQGGELCPQRVGAGAGSRSLRECVWGLWLLLLWAGSACPSSWEAGEELHQVKEGCSYPVWPQPRILLPVLKSLVLFFLKVFSS